MGLCGGVTTRSETLLLLTVLTFPSLLAANPLARLLLSSSARYRACRRSWERCSYLELSLDNVRCCQG